MHVYFIRISFTSFFLQIEFSTQPMVGPYNNAATAAVRAFSILSDERIRAGEIAVVSHAHQLTEQANQEIERQAEIDRKLAGMRRIDY
jgi:succinyl-CoA synthetase alpha subunit